MGNNLLADLTRAQADLQDARAGFTPYKERWYSWNYWAQHRQKLFSFSSWMAECNVEFEDVAGSKAHYPEADVIYSRGEGYNYYSAWRGAQQAVDDAEKKFDLIFRTMWNARTPSGQPTYSPKELSEALGKDTEQFRKFAAKRSWYKPRNNPKGTK